MCPGFDYCSQGVANFGEGEDTHPQPNRVEESDFSLREDLVQEGVHDNHVDFLTHVGTQRSWIVIVAQIEWRIQQSGSVRDL